MPLPRYVYGQSPRVTQSLCNTQAEPGGGGRGRWRIGDIQKEADCGQMKVDTDEDALKAVNPSCRASPYVIMNTNPHHVSAGDDTVTPTRPKTRLQPSTSSPHRPLHYLQNQWKIIPPPKEILYSFLFAINGRKRRKKELYNIQFKAMQ